MTSGGGEGSKGGRRCLVEEGTHGTGLPEKSLHGEESNIVKYGECLYNAAIESQV